MGVTAVVLHVVLLACAASTTAILAGYAWRQPEHGTRPFVGLLLAFTLYSGAHLIGLLTVHPQWRLVWENIQWTSTAVLPVCWLLFALAYTGHDELITWDFPEIVVEVPSQLINRLSLSFVGCVLTLPAVQAGKDRTDRGGVQGHDGMGRPAAALTPRTEDVVTRQCTT